jgi:hypothetical protein
MIKKLKKIKPMFTALVTTMDTYTDSELMLPGGLIDTSKKRTQVKEFQTVIAIGNTVRDIRVGDVVCIDPSRYAVMKHKEGSLKDGIITDNPVMTYRFDVINLDGKDCLLLQNNDIKYIVKEYANEKGLLVVPNPEEKSVN